VRRQLRFTHEADAQLRTLRGNLARKGLQKQVLKALALLELDTRHPGLHTHEYQSIVGPQGERIWEAYAQNDTASAYRIFFRYGPDETLDGKRIAILTILSITPHP
jgi:hypothetical protein